MEKTILFPAINLVVFTIKTLARGASTAVMFLDGIKGNLVSTISFFRRADKASISKNLTSKAGLKEVKEIRNDWRNF